jgi:hypothetical protein
MFLFKDSGNLFRKSMKAFIIDQYVASILKNKSGVAASPKALYIKII